MKRRIDLESCSKGSVGWRSGKVGRIVANKIILDFLLYPHPPSFFCVLLLLDTHPEKVLTPALSSSFLVSIDHQSKLCLRFYSLCAKRRTNFGIRSRKGEAGLVFRLFTAMKRYRNSDEYETSF